MPNITGKSAITYNGIFEILTITLIVPILIGLGASGKTTDNLTARVSKFLGNISFSVYIVHYPLMYLFYSWLIENKLYTFGETWQIALIVMAGSVVIAWLCLKFYDEPVRKWLTKKFLSKKKS